MMNDLNAFDSFTECGQENFTEAEWGDDALCEVEEYGAAECYASDEVALDAAEDVEGVRQGRRFKLSASKVLLSIIMLLVLTAVAVEVIPFEDVGVVASAATAAELKEKQAKLQSELDSISSQLSALKTSKASAQEQLDMVNELIANLEEQIDTVNDQIEATNEEIEQLEADIAQTDLEIEESKEKFKDRLRAIYISGDMTGGLELLLCSNGLQEFLTNTVYLETMAAYDQSLIDQLTSDKAGYQDKLVEVEEKKAEINEQKEELAEKKTELDEQQAEAAALVAEIQAEQEALEEEQAEIDQQMATAKAQLDAIVNANTATSQSTDYVGGSFTWPVPGYKTITSYFGYRTYKYNGKTVSSNHKGIDIAATSGVKIVAANSGTVVTSAYDANGYGNYVIIDHGGGKMTVYGHMTKRLVSVGTYVTKGQQIGTVGSTGRSTGPHCHFEVRINGTAVNPLNYL